MNSHNFVHEEVRTKGRTCMRERGGASATALVPRRPARPTPTRRNPEGRFNGNLSDIRRKFFNE
jgi:hypothetical protein